VIDDDLMSRFGLSAGDSRFRQLDLITGTLPGTLTFLDEARFADALLANPNIAGAIVTPDLADLLRGAGQDLVVIEHEDPRWAYFSLHNALAERDYRTWPSEVAATADVHPSAVIGETNVKIGQRSVIGPHVTILADVEIGDDCVVQPGTVIGSTGFEMKRTKKGVLSVVHDGLVRIGDHVEIGANTCIDKGFRNKPTMIENDARIDNLIHVAHGARIGRGAFIVAGSVLGGSVVVGSEAWLSINASIAPGVTVGDGAFVSIGAVATRDVPKGTQVTGNFAIPHQQFIQLFKRWLAGPRASDDNESGCA
jgi:UDP-3-O-[3-hydroxymyristoyl] glucosamine N-acyltransferase